MESGAIRARAAARELDKKKRGYTPWKKKKVRRGEWKEK